MRVIVMGGVGSSSENAYLEIIKAARIANGLDRASNVENNSVKETNTDEKAKNQIEEKKKEELREQMLGSQQALGNSNSYSIRKYYLG